MGVFHIQIKSCAQQPNFRDAKHSFDDILIVSQYVCPFPPHSQSNCAALVNRNSFKILELLNIKYDESPTHQEEINFMECIRAH